MKKRCYVCKSTINPEGGRWHIWEAFKGYERACCSYTCQEILKERKQASQPKPNPAPATFGPQEPPNDPRIFNRRQSDGSFRPLAEFFDRGDQHEMDTETTMSNNQHITGDCHMSLDEARAGAEPVLIEPATTIPSSCAPHSGAGEARAQDIGDIVALPTCAICHSALPVALSLCASCIESATNDLIDTLLAVSIQRDTLRTTLDEAAMWFHQLADHKGERRACETYHCQQFNRVLAETKGAA